MSREAEEIVRRHHRLWGRYRPGENRSTVGGGKPLSELNDAAGQASRAIDVADDWSASMLATPDTRIGRPTRVEMRHRKNPRLHEVSVVPSDYEKGNWYVSPAKEGGQSSEPGVLLYSPGDGRETHREIVDRVRGGGGIFHEAAHGDAAEDSRESADERRWHAYQARARDNADFYDVDPNNPPDDYLQHISGPLGYESPPEYKPGLDLEAEYRRIPAEQRAHHSQVLGLLWDAWNQSGRQMHPSDFVEAWLQENHGHPAVQQWAIGRTHSSEDEYRRRLAGHFRVLAGRRGVRGIAPVDRWLDARVDKSPQSFGKQFDYEMSLRHEAEEIVARLGG